MNLLSVLDNFRRWPIAAILVAMVPAAHAATVTLNGATCDGFVQSCRCTYDDSVGVGEEAIIEVYKVDAPAGPLAGLSTRGKVGRISPMMAGFVIQSDVSQRVIVRARGPSLGVANGIANPALQVYSTAGQIASNDDWEHQSDDATVNTAAVEAIRSSGFAPTNALESAVLLTLAPGAYTAHIFGGTGDLALTCSGAQSVNSCAMTASATSVAVGESVTFTATCPGGIDRWSVSPTTGPAISGNSGNPPAVAFPTAGTYTYTVYGVTALPDSRTITVGSSNNNPATCGAGILCYNTLNTSGQHVITMSGSEVAAVSIAMGPGRSRLPFSLQKGWAGRITPETVQYSISSTPGDFSGAWPCGDSFSVPTIGFQVVSSTQTVQWGTCPVDASATQYLNLRFPGGSCPAGSNCTVVVEWYWNQ